jgi:TatD DNase family protein
MELFDICVNLASERFDSDRDQIVHRAIAAGVKYIALTGSCLESSRRARDWAEKSPDLCSTAGIHPHGAEGFNGSDIHTLRRLADSHVVKAIGECGLDYNRDFSPKEDQKKCFAAQIQLSQELGLPLFLHHRDALEDFTAILDEAGELPPAVVHCFTHDREALYAFLDRGFSIGVTGWICDERRGDELRELAKEIPLDRLMIETDAPWLTPRDMRPKPKRGRNEPAFLPHILDRIAGHMGLPVDEVAEHSTSNALKFFGMV